MDQQRAPSRFWPAVFAIAIVIAILWIFLAALRPWSCEIVGTPSGNKKIGTHGIITASNR
jgi:hypothetical protein